MKRWVIILSGNVIPVVCVHLTAAAYWLDDHSGDNTAVAIFETLFTMCILPLWLVVLNYCLSQSRNYVATLSIMLFAILLSVFLAFRNWANSVGLWRWPTGETLAVIQLKISIASIIVVISTLVFAVIRKKRSALRR